MKSLFIIIFILSGCLLSIAQPGALDLSFEASLPQGCLVSSIAIQHDEKIIVGGYFLDLNGLPAGGYLARLLPDGSHDSTFQTGNGPSSYVLSVAVQDDGKILVAGAFHTFNSFTSYHFVRLNQNGSVDTGFNIGGGFSYIVHEVALQPDGKILAGGEFTEYNGVTCNRLARLNPDGSLDTTFNTTAGASGTVETMAIQPDGKIVIGGDFIYYDGGWHIRIARVNPDGSRDVTFRDTSGLLAVVEAVALQPDGKILAGGSFTSYVGHPSNHIIRLMPDGGRDGSFYVDDGADHSVSDFEVLPNGNILFSGGFWNFKNTPVKCLALVNPSCILDTSFNSNVGTGPDGSIGAITLQQDGKILISGGFTSYNGIARTSIARIFNCSTPRPGALSGSDSILCAAALTFSIAPVPNAERYEWTPPSGWSGTSDSASITVTSNGESGVISVRAFSDSCGYSDWQTKTIYRVHVPEQPICLVTVDDSSAHNIVVWEKITTNLIDSFFIYRETATNVYTKIGSLSYHALNEYHDYDANPNATSYRYKISSVDTCGVESELSPFHNTIHLQYLGHGSFIWTFYQIEGALNPVTSFNVYRDALGDGNFQQIGLVPGTNATFTDIDHAAFPNSVYRVDVNWSRPCISAVPTINTTRSNIRRKTDEVSIQTLSPEYISIHPNPAEDVISVQFISPTGISEVQLLNSLGQTIWRETNFNSTASAAKTIHVGAFPKGVYILVAETSRGWLRRKVIMR